MKKIHRSFRIIAFTAIVLISLSSTAQDKIYRTDGTVIKAKINQVEPTIIRFTRADVLSGPTYTMKLKEIDSIVYENGVVDDMHVLAPRRVMKNNVPQKNTWNFNVLGFAHLSINQAYERRLKKEFIGIRVPLYIGFATNYIAGVGTFLPFEGVDPYNNYDNYYTRRTCNIATGINPKFYFNKHRVVRVFAGPEANIGISFYRNQYYYWNNGQYYTPQESETRVMGTFTGMGIMGLSINPKDRFNITVTGGAGTGILFDKYGGQELLGVWQIGISLGTNF